MSIIQKQVHQTVLYTVTLSICSNKCVSDVMVSVLSMEVWKYPAIKCSPGKVKKAATQAIKHAK